MSPFLLGITWLLLFQCAGEGASRLFDWPVPGPVVGMIGLFVALRLWGRTAESLNTSADDLARHLSLLFVPAGVGVMPYFERLAQEWVPIVTALLVSTVLTVAAAGWTFSRLMRPTQRDGEKSTPEQS